MAGCLVFICRKEKFYSKSSPSVPRNCLLLRFEYVISSSPLYFVSFLIRLHVFSHGLQNQALNLLQSPWFGGSTSQLGATTDISSSRKASASPAHSSINSWKKHSHDTYFTATGHCCNQGLLFNSALHMVTHLPFTSCH